MEEIRKIEFYKEHFVNFYLSLPADVQSKYEYVFVVIRQAERVPVKFFKKLTGTKNLFEIRVEYQSNIYRTFCCLEKDRIVVLFNSFQKKTSKTPKKEIETALELQNEYYESRNSE